MTQENKTIKHILLYRLILITFLLIVFDGYNNRTRYCTFCGVGMPSNQARGIMGRRTLKTSLLPIAFMHGITCALPGLECLAIFICILAIFML